MDELQQAPQAKPAPLESSPWARSFRNSALALAALGIVGIAAGRYFPYDIPLLGHSTDYLSKEQIRERAELFNAVGTLPLQSVDRREVGSAVTSMELDANAKVALLADIDRQQQSQARAAVPAPLPTPAAQTGAEVSNTAASQPDQNAQPSPVAPPPESAPAEKPRPATTGLVWITLWDTNDEDGDVVRIDSGGYSRTVSLTKQPLTFAVPIPAGGTINVTGIRDGEGGGITVGAGSGPARTMLPIMSVGQVIGLHVGAQ